MYVYIILIVTITIIIIIIYRYTYIYIYIYIEREREIHTCCYLLSLLLYCYDKVAAPPHPPADGSSLTEQEPPTPDK